MVDLEPGQQLQHSYSYTLNGTAQRQEHLKTGKYFDCDCKRCKDPTELGTNFSTFKCSKCEDGWLLWSDPLGKSLIFSNSRNNKNNTHNISSRSQNRMEMYLM